MKFHQHDIISAMGSAFFGRDTSKPPTRQAFVVHTFFFFFFFGGGEREREREREK